MSQASQVGRVLVGQFQRALPEKLDALRSGTMPTVETHLAQDVLSAIHQLSQRALQEDAFTAVATLTYLVQPLLAQLISCVRQHDELRNGLTRLVAANSTLPSIIGVLNAGQSMPALAQAAATVPTKESPREIEAPNAASKINIAHQNAPSHQEQSPSSEIERGILAKTRAFFSKGKVNSIAFLAARQIWDKALAGGTTFDTLPIRSEELGSCALAMGLPVGAISRCVDLLIMTELMTRDPAGTRGAYILTPLFKSLLADPPRSNFSPPQTAVQALAGNFSDCTSIEWRAIADLLTRKIPEEMWSSSWTSQQLLQLSAGAIDDTGAGCELTQTSLSRICTCGAMVESEGSPKRHYRFSQDTISLFRSRGGRSEMVPAAAELPESQTVSSTENVAPSDPPTSEGTDEGRTVSPTGETVVAGTPGEVAPQPEPLPEHQEESVSEAPIAPAPLASAPPTEEAKPQPSVSTPIALESPAVAVLQTTPLDMTVVTTPKPSEPRTFDLSAALTRIGVQGPIAAHARQLAKYLHANNSDDFVSFINLSVELTEQKSFAWLTLESLRSALKILVDAEFLFEGDDEYAILDRWHSIK